MKTWTGILGLTALLWNVGAWAGPTDLAPLELQTVDLQFTAQGLGRTSIQDRNDRGDLLVASTAIDNFALLRTQDGEETRISCAGNGLTLAQAVNNRRQVVGSCPGRAGAIVGFLRLPQSGVMLRLQAPGAVQTQAYGINDRQLIVGDYRGTSGPIHGFRWQNDHFTTIDAPGADIVATTLLAINNWGTIVGLSVSNAGVVQGFVLRGDTFTPVAVPDARETIPLDINDNDEVVGVFLPPTGPVQSFLFDGSTYSAITTPYPEIVQTEVSGLTTTGVMSGRVLVGAFSRGLIARGLTLNALGTVAPLAAATRAQPAHRAVAPDLQRWCGHEAPGKVRDHAGLCGLPE